MFKPLLEKFLKFLFGDLGFPPMLFFIILDGLIIYAIYRIYPAVFMILKNFQKAKKKGILLPSVLFALIIFLGFILCLVLSTLLIVDIATGKAKFNI